MRYMLVILIVGGLLFGAIALGRFTDSSSRAALEARAREAEARAAYTAALADKLQAEAAVTQAEADYRLHDAAAYSIEKQAQLVAYYAHRGWLTAVWLVSLLVTLLAIWLIVREWKRKHA